jgi:hypothetical protein
MKFNCPHCTQRLHGEEGMEGKVVRCPNCNRRLTIPRAPEAPEPQPEPQPAAKRKVTVQKRKIIPAAQPSSAIAQTPAPKPPPKPRTGISSKPQRTDSTNVSLSVSFAMGLLLGGSFYGLAFILLKGTHFGQLFLERGWVPYVLVLLMGWSVGILILKVRKLQRQKQAMLLDVLPSDLAEEITPDNVGEFLDHIDSLPARLHESFMVKRMRLGLEHFDVRHSNPEVASMMMSQSEIDGGTIHSSYSLLKAFIWAIPILGFIGTVIGISAAVGGFAGSLAQVQDIELLKTSLNDVTGGLAVAFDTTLIALIMSLIVSIPASVIQKAEEDLLGWVDVYCNDNLLKRLNDAGGISDVAVHTEAIMGSLGAAVAGNQQEVMEDLRAVQARMEEIQRDHKLLLDNLATAVDRQLKTMEDRASEHEKKIEERASSHQEKIEEHLGKMVEPVEKAATSLSEAAGTAGKGATESMQASADAVRSTCDSLTDGLQSLNSVLKELGGRQIVIEKKPRAWFSFGRRKEAATGDEKETSEAT